MFIVFVDYQRLTMVPTCSSMCFNDLLCSSSCCDDDRKLSMSDWAFCVNPCVMCNPTETETIYYIYIWVVDSDCIFHLVTATCRYECMLSIHMMSWIIWYTWIYMCAWYHFRFFFPRLFKGARWRHLDPLRWHDQPWLCPRVTGG